MFYVVFEVQLVFVSVLHLEYPLIGLILLPEHIFEQISNATVFNFWYFNSDISFQEFFSNMSVWGYEVSFC